MDSVDKRALLTKLTIDEGSGVDMGANQYAKIKMKKRDELFSSTPLPSGNDIGLKLRKNALREAQIEAYMKREFSDEDRKRMTAVGHAMPDGSYPIGDTKDLKNAIQAIGRAKNPSKTKSHIVRRARELGATRHLPDKWIRKSLDKSFDAIAFLMKSEGGEDFNTELNEMKSLDFGEGLMEAVHDAGHAMKHSIESIMDDDGTADKGAAIRASFGQFLDHVKTIAPEGDVAKSEGAVRLRSLAKRAKESLMARAFNKAYESVGQNDKTGRRQEIDEKTGKLVDVDDDMEDPREARARSGANATDGQFDGKMKKKLRKAQARFKSLLEMAKADPDAKKYMDDENCEMDDDVAKQFIDMSKAERHAYMDANPIDERAMQKRLDNLPAEVRKTIEAGREAQEQLNKRLEAENLSNFTKRAMDARLASPKEIAPHLVELHKAAPDALAKVWSAVEVMAKSVHALEQTGFIFKEFGNRQATPSNGASPYETLMAKAQEMVDDNKSPTVQQAFAKLFESRDPAIRELIKQGKADGSLGIAS